MAIRKVTLNEIEKQVQAKGVFRKDFMDAEGKRFGIVTVFAYLGFKTLWNKRIHFWGCKCDCGQHFIASHNALITNQCASCGCRSSCKLIGQNSITHGRSNTPEYRTWATIKERCTNPNVINYARYGGRGIKMCEEWMESFEAFFNYVGPRPSPSHSIERVKNSGHYEPGNVVWATRQTQGRNKRNNRIVTIDGQSKTLAEWSEISGVDYHLIKHRIYDGWDAKLAVFSPAGSRRRKSSYATG